MNITPITMVFVGDISIIFMGFINNFLTFGGTTLYKQWDIYHLSTGDLDFAGPEKPYHHSII